jgi:2-methylisocitrate lyase-like PEP mutase family enzyme
MTSSDSRDFVAAKAESLRALHSGPRMLVLPNAWDAASARSFEAAGFPAIATTSGGVAAALGYPDHEAAPVEEMVAAARRIVAAVSVPVTVDFEAGYGLAASEILERLLGIGAAGFNLEDSIHHDGRGLRDRDLQAESIHQLRQAARAAGSELVINARIDVFIERLGTPEEQLQEGLQRAKLYWQAGADCVYPIALSDEAMLAEFTKQGAVNINVRRGGPLTLLRAAALGIRRVSYATSLFRETMAYVDSISQDVRSQANAIL